MRKKKERWNILITFNYDTNKNMLEYTVSRGGITLCFLRINRGVYSCISIHPSSSKNTIYCRPYWILYSIVHICQLVKQFLNLKKILCNLIGMGETYLVHILKNNFSFCWYLPLFLWKIEWFKNFIRKLTYFFVRLVI